MFIENIERRDDMTPTGVTCFPHNWYFYKHLNPPGLETAKCGVELAIEENEDAALRYIEGQQKDASGIACL